MALCSGVWRYSIFNDFTLLLVKMKKPILFFLVSLFFFIEKTNAQCAMCRAVLETAEGQSTAEGVNDGIVYLMAIPYLLIAGLGYFIYRKYNTLKK